MEVFGPRAIWAGVYDAYSARVAGDAGFSGLWLSSFGVSAALKAVRDASLVTWSEMMDVARYVSHASATPLVVDCDSGYGGPDIFADVTRRYAASTDVAALCIEDKLFPKLNSFHDDPQVLVPTDVQCEFLRCSLHARGASSDLRIIARTEALIAGAGVDATLERLHAYAQSGADALLIQAKGPLGELLEVGSRWQEDGVALPLVCVPTAYETEHPETFWSRGYGVVCYANQILRSSTAVMRAATEVLALGNGLPPDLQMSSMRDIDLIVKERKH